MELGKDNKRKINLVDIKEYDSLARVSKLCLLVIVLLGFNIFLWYGFKSQKIDKEFTIIEKFTDEQDNYCYDKEKNIHKFTLCDNKRDTVNILVNRKTYYAYDKGDSYNKVTYKEYYKTYDDKSILLYFYAWLLLSVAVFGFLLFSVIMKDAHNCNDFDKLIKDPDLKEYRTLLRFIDFIISPLVSLIILSFSIYFYLQWN